MFRINVRDFVGGIKFTGEFTSPRLFLVFYYAYKERLKHGESIEAYRGDNPLTVWARPSFVDTALDRLARTTL